MVLAESQTLSPPASQPLYVPMARDTTPFLVTPVPSSAALVAQLAWIQFLGGLS